MKLLRRSFICVLVAAFILPTYLSGQVVWPNPLRAKRGMVASNHEIASRIGVEILRKGGNAVDAAIAVGLALAVVYPEAGNIGGGGFMLLRKPNGEVRAIDYRERAPAAASSGMYMNQAGQPIKGEGSSSVGYRASGVPGTVAGFDHAFTNYGSGRIRWRELVRPAREIAERGFALSYRVTELLRKDGELAKYEDTKRIFLNGGALFAEGDTLVQADLARTLRRIELRGAREFYTGETARLIAADMKANGGLITLEDLKAYKPVDRTPLHGTYRGHEIITMPPPSSGGIVLLQVLNMLERYDMGKLGSNSAARFHLIVEAERRAFGDRAEFMGDPDFTRVPVAKLIDKNYAAQRATSIGLSRASNSRETNHGEAGPRESNDTTHFTIVDKDGMVVSNTYTINDLFGSRVTAKGTGILMNNEMDDFTSQPGKPNIYGLVQGDRNKVEPGKRPLSSMTPTIVLNKNGSLWFATGARGGPRIISAVLQIVLNVIDHDMNLQAAMDAPRVHHQWLPDEIRYEPVGISSDTLAILASYGHKFIDKPDNVAAASAIMIDPKGVRLGAVDVRADGLAVGY
jgi:gamma-glutamyltranspeptidase/glutathione hydrolase